ncbi:pyridoxal phosphate-dependent decarboxylase family protein [Flagellimonas meridianipacifica]|uniref:L-2,4-diaminobutyrate decarboxylase n=1 Tax=Flagellimonas meridianipacifica TaxID=1080225 RepID=A0A2T0M9Y3_9FLAO|nr:aminotransferase class I/II-fold pyridoxal phosphate-dependent enzyme [Allomuricauda pacifica]PRX54347.1 L-2,4-diaminobutyrate decarboxylase [Allomuricauda pacifica]
MESKSFEKIFSSVTFKDKSHRLVNLICEHIEGTISGKEDKVLSWNPPDNELQFWKDFLENGNEADFFKEILKRTTHTHNPKYVGHQVGVTAPITLLSGMLSNLLNNGMAVYEMGMSSNAIERIVADKICETVGYDSKSGGFLTSGGTLANLTALLSARKAKVEHDVWNEGHTKPLGIMVCEEAHYCVDRAAKIMGLGEKGIIKVPANKNFGMDVNKMEEYYRTSVSQGIQVFAIVGSAPSTATGAYDDLEAIQAFAQKYDLWFHVDGAHGGAAIFSEKYKHLLKGAEKSDSMVIDGHKMMLMPTITTALVFRNRIHANHTFSLDADYLLNETQEDEWYNSGRRTFECTKTMMCMHWYLLLKLYGEAVFDTYVTRQYDLAKDFAEMLLKEPDFEIATYPMSNILCFRYVNPNLSLKDLNELNAMVRQELLEEGDFYMVQTTIRGVHYLRTSLMNPFATVEHLKVLTNKIRSASEKLLQEIKQ